MKRLAIAGMMVLGLLSGCSGDKSKELFDTAQFEEKQHNSEHALQLYQEIVSKYPDSPLAKQAQERMTALGKK
ncbi:lipoprotein [Geomonas sp. Red276]